AAIWPSSPMSDDPVQDRLPDQGFGIFPKRGIGMPEVLRSLAIRQALHDERCHIPAASEGGRVDACPSEPSRCTGQKNWKGDLAEMIIERHVALAAERRINIE